jgi:hypothetical protein
LRSRYDDLRSLRRRLSLLRAVSFRLLASPVPRRESSDVGGGCRRHALQDVLELGLYVDPSELAAQHERVQVRCNAAALLAGEDQPVLAVGHDMAKVALGVVVVDRKPTVVEVCE